MEKFLEPLGISQNRVAKELNVPPRRIYEIVQGQRSINADMAHRLAHYFGMSERFKKEKGKVERCRKVSSLLLAFYC